jgi:hypothetical protein
MHYAHMVKACMDESGIHDGAHVCVVAGYWGSLKKWKRFEPRWKEIISSVEPTLKEFHSVEFWNSTGGRKGAFAGWSDAKADKFIGDLADCIVDSGIYATSAVLVTEAWKKLNKDERSFLTGGYYHTVERRWLHPGAPNRIYFSPFLLALGNPAMGCAPGLHVHYIFDLNKQFRNHALTLFHLLKKDDQIRFRHRLGGIDFETSDKIVGLQAADLLVHQIYKFSKNQIGRNEPFPQEHLPPLLRKLISNAKAGGDQQFPFLDEQGLNMALQQIPAHMRGVGWHPITTEQR